MLPLRNWLARWLDRIGRRGAFVVLMGTVFALLGLGEILNPTVGEASRAVLHGVLPSLGWGMLFLGTGFVAVVEGVWRKKNNNVVSIVTMSALSGMWAVGNFAAAAVIPGSKSDSLIGGIVWLLITGVIQIVAGWPDYGNRDTNVGD